MDIEWARDGDDGKLYIVRARPETVFTVGQLPNEGIGLARLESVIDDAIGMYPKARFNYDTLDAATKASVDARMKGYCSPKDFYVQKIVKGVVTLESSYYPQAQHRGGHPGRPGGVPGETAGEGRGERALQELRGGQVPPEMHGQAWRR